MNRRKFIQASSAATIGSIFLPSFLKSDTKIPYMPLLQSTYIDNAALYAGIINENMYDLLPNWFIYLENNKNKCLFKYQYSWGSGTLVHYEKDSKVVQIPVIPGSRKLKTIFNRFKLEDTAQLDELYDEVLYHCNNHMSPWQSATEPNNIYSFHSLFNYVPGDYITEHAAQGRYGIILRAASVWRDLEEGEAVIPIDFYNSGQGIYNKHHKNKTTNMRIIKQKGINGYE